MSDNAYGALHQHRLNRSVPPQYATAIGIPTPRLSPLRSPPVTQNTQLSSSVVTTSLRMHREHRADAPRMKAVPGAPRTPTTTAVPIRLLPANPSGAAPPAAVLQAAPPTNFLYGRDDYLDRSAKSTRILGGFGAPSSTRLPLGKKPEHRSPRPFATHENLSLRVPALSSRSNHQPGPANDAGPMTTHGSSRMVSFPRQLTSPNSPRWSTLKGTYEYQAADGTIVDDRNLILGVDPRYLPPGHETFSSRKSRTPATPIVPRAVLTYLKIEERQKRSISGGRSAAFIKARLELERLLGGALTRAADLFKSFDKDGSGTIDRDEFRTAMRELGWKCPTFAKGSNSSWGTDDVCDSLFAACDIDDSGQIDWREYVKYALRSCLARAQGRVLDWLIQWDTDGSGKIERAEWRRATRELGLDAPDEDLNSIFDEVDVDGSGFVDYVELHNLLRQGAAVRLSSEMRSGAQGAIELSSSTRHGEFKSNLKIPTRKNGINERTGPMREATLEELRRELSVRAMRVMDLFRAFDRDGDHRVTRSEFRAALPLLGFRSSSTAAIDALFNSLDEDCSGYIDHDELHACLRQGEGVTLKTVLQDGARGEIGIAPANQIALRHGLDDASQFVTSTKMVSLEAMQEALFHHWSRVLDIFRTLDRNRDGTVTKAEFRAMLPLLGFDNSDESRDVIDAIFDEIDDDASGLIEYEELAEKLELRGAARNELRPADNSTFEPRATHPDDWQQHVRETVNGPLSRKV